jgi:hypothetical protein
MRTSSIAIFKYLFLLFKHLNIYNKHRYSNIYFYRAFSGKLAGLQVVLGFDEVVSVMTIIPMTFTMTLKPSVVIMMINKMPHSMFNLMIIMLLIMVLMIKIIRVILNMKVCQFERCPLCDTSHSPSRQTRRAGQPLSLSASSLFSQQCFDHRRQGLFVCLTHMTMHFDRQKAHLANNL